MTAHPAATAARGSRPDRLPPPARQAPASAPAAQTRSASAAHWILRQSQRAAARDKPESSASALRRARLRPIGAADGFHLMRRSTAARLRQIADLHQRIDKEAQAQLRSAGGPPLYAARRSARSCSRSDITLRTDAGDSGIGDQARNVARADRLAGGEIRLSTICRKISRDRSLSSPARHSADRIGIVVGQFGAPWEPFLLQLYLV
jgi:hypothetical protein